jgi:hypothetical protein
MGVMSCNRSGCESIMCDTYIPSVGYVCTYCQSDFKEYLSQGYLKSDTEGDIERALEVFMETKKGHYNSNEISVDEFFKRHTR